MATDLIQRVYDALVAILDDHPSIVAITTRPNGNIFPFEDSVDATLPNLSYFDVTTANAGGIGDTRRVIVQITAAAGTKAIANALLEVVEDELTTTAFTAAGLDAAVMEFQRRGVPGDSEEGAYSADMDVTLLVTK